MNLLFLPSIKTEGEARGLLNSTYNRQTLNEKYMEAEAVGRGV